MHTYNKSYKRIHIRVGTGLHFDKPIEGENITSQSILHQSMVPLPVIPALETQMLSRRPAVLYGKTLSNDNHRTEDVTKGKDLAV